MRRFLRGRTDVQRQANRYNKKTEPGRRSIHSGLKKAFVIISNALGHSCVVSLRHKESADGRRAKAMTFTRRNFLRLSGAAALTPVWRRFVPLADSDHAALCRKLASDPLRPQYHLLPAHNWMNDPNGPIFFRGHYHMFHQYNPQAAVWGNMNWAHATSPDMLHWQHEPIAISPTPGGPDQDGVFSGSAVLDNGKPTVIYTAVAAPPNDADATLRDGHHTWRETQCLAVAKDDDLRTWKKLSEPVIAAPPAGLAVTGFRDPCLWREGNTWMLILGSGTHARGGSILLYTSSDLRHWTYLHPLVEGSPSNKDTTNPVDTGDMWECPDFFPLGAKHVLLISTMGKVRWKVGNYANQRFIPRKKESWIGAHTMRQRPCSIATATAFSGDGFQNRDQTPISSPLDGPERWGFRG